MSAKRLKAIVSARDATIVPGASNALFARVIEKFGFETVYISGAGRGDRSVRSPRYPSEQCWRFAAVHEVRHARGMGRGHNLNFHAGRELTHAFLDGMRKRKFGRIFNLTGSTEAGAKLNAGMPPNGVVTLWAKALSRVVGVNGVTVNCVAPGRLRSEQIDLRLLPDEESRQR